ncbi:O-antigen ligase [Demequina sp. NBRC 110057]|uniref:O-antigen ligase family protein n=1 Tax=Demequina sp. NBRC 110057 TaxID=1570346 RepID=UPI0013562AAC|nr:O-antigen ligase family protein [Demequina sp. NBRC 110057]
MTIWAVVFLTSGQGFRYLLGIPLYAVVAIATVVLVVVSFRPTWRDLAPPLLIGAFVALVTASILWSATRGVTALAAVVTIATTLVAIITVRGSTNVRFMVLLLRGLQVSLALGIAFELFVAVVIRGPLEPFATGLSDLAGHGSTVVWSDGQLFSGGPIEGFVGNRNPFGAIALLTAIVALVLVLERRISKIDFLVTMAAALFVHVMTMSATVTAAGALVVVLIAAAFVLRRARGVVKRYLSFTMLAGLAIGSVLVLKYRDLLFAALDRRGDLTNRTFIWDEVVHYAWQRPEGWGFVGYWPVWDEPYSSIVDSVQEQAGWPVVPTHAHNAFLDAWLQLGLIGLALLLVIVVLMFGSAWRLVERAERGDSYIPLGWALLAAVLAVQSLTESRMLVESGWFLVVALYCMGPQVFTLTVVDPDLVHYGTRLEQRPPREPGTRWWRRRDGGGAVTTTDEPQSPAAP